MEPLPIRLAMAGDLDAIPKIEIAAAAMFSEADLPHEIRHRVTKTANLRDAMDNERLWVAVTPDDLSVGFAMADVVDGEAHLSEMDVMPEFGKQGIGTRLLGTVITWARGAGFSMLTLVTFRHLPWNMPFYQRIGFTPLEPAQHADELTGLIEEEGRLGINIADRVAMSLNL